MSALRALAALWLLVALALAGCGDETNQFQEGSEGQLSVTPSALAFNPIAIGEQTTQVVMVENIGDGALSLPASSDHYILEPPTAPFYFEYVQVDGQTVERLEPGQQGQLAVTFSPQSDARPSATLTLSSPNGGSQSIALNVVQPQPILIVQPNPVAFDGVEPGSSNSVDVTVLNDGTALLVIDEMTFTGLNTADFSLGSTLDTPLELAPSASARFEMVYTPTGDAAEVDRGELVFTTNSAGAINGLITVEVIGTVDAPRIEVEPVIVDFGAVPAGTAETQSLFVRNVGTSTLEVRDISLSFDTSTDFSYNDATELTLAPGEEQALTIGYAPTDGGRDTGLLVLSTNDPLDLEVPVELRATLSAPVMVIQPKQLNFGSVLASTSKPLSFAIINDGTEVLTIDRFEEIDFPADATLSVVATIDASNVSPPFDIFPGDQASVSVTYAPLGDTGSTQAATLRVHGNDPDNASEDVAITFRGVAQGECEVELVPIKLDFGLVPGGDTRQMSLMIRNKGVAPCRVASVYLSGGSVFFGQNPFTLATPFTPNTTLAAGDSILLPIDYAPYRGSETEEFSSQAVVTVFDAITNQEAACTGYPTPAFPNPSDICQLGSLFGGFGGGGPNCWACLAGTTGDPALAAVPNPLEFGLVTLGCSSQTIGLRIYNKGSAPADITSIALDPTCAANFQIVGGMPILPATLASGQYEELEVVYTPTATVADACRIEVDSPSGSIIIPLSGEGTTETEVVDEFIQVSGRKVDVLFVVDDSGSMGDEQSSLASNFSSFIQAAQTWGIDFQIGVTSTDMSGDPDPFNPTGGATGRLYPLSGSGYPRILSPTTPSLEQAFQSNIQLGTNGSATERGLDAAYAALSDPLVTSDVPGQCPGSPSFPDACPAPYSCQTFDQSCGGWNARFLRDDASLEVIFVSDEEDSSTGAVDFYIDFFKNIKGYRNDSLFHANAIVGDDSGTNCNPINRYTEVSNQTGGLVGSLCNNFATTLANIGNNAFGLRVQFFLSRVPDMATVRVFVDGAEVTTGWEYDPASNAVVFTADVPDPDQTIRVTYRARCFPAP